MNERRQLWSAHNSLRSHHPLMLVFPEGAWLEMIPGKTFACHSELARLIEMRLRQTIYTYEHFHDDTIVEAEWITSEWWNSDFISDTGWGVGIERKPQTADRGSFGFQPVIRNISDLRTLHHPEVIYDQVGHIQNLEKTHALFGDIFEVKKAGIKHISFHMMKLCTGWIGLENIMFDMGDRPDFVHEVMTFIEEGHQKWLDQLVNQNLLSLNNDNTYQSTGGNVYTNEIPEPGFNPGRVRSLDLWSSSESQEFQIVSPQMHNEFALEYEKRCWPKLICDGNSGAHIP